MTEAYEQASLNFPVMTKIEIRFEATADRFFIFGWNKNKNPIIFMLTRRIIIAFLKQFSNLVWSNSKAARSHADYQNEAFAIELTASAEKLKKNKSNESRSYVDPKALRGKRIALVTEIKLENRSDCIVVAFVGGDEDKMLSQPNLQKPLAAIPLNGEDALNLFSIIYSKAIAADWNLKGLFPWMMKEIPRSTDTSKVN